MLFFVSCSCEPSTYLLNPKFKAEARKPIRTAESFLPLITAYLKTRNRLYLGVGLFSLMAIMKMRDASVKPKAHSFRLKEL
jgi:hypothetical protein